MAARPHASPNRGSHAWLGSGPGVRPPAEAVGKLCDWSAFQLRFGLIAVHQIEGSVCCKVARAVVKVDLLKGAAGLTGHKLESLLGYTVMLGH